MTNVVHKSLLDLLDNIALKMPLKKRNLVNDS
jgi:hypothetical protein